MSFNSKETRDRNDKQRSIESGPVTLLTLQKIQATSIGVYRRHSSNHQKPEPRE